MNVIRKASEKDIPSLMKLANICFPHSIYWALSNRTAYRRWEFAVRSTASEVWVYAEPTGIQGFSLALVDETDWLSSSYLFEISRFRKFILAFQNPRRGYAFVKKCFRKKEHLKPSVANLPVLEPRLFVDLFGVAPTGRRKGVASALVNNNIERASKLGKDFVVYNVDRNNRPMLDLMKKHGLVTAAINQKQVTFAKKLKE